MNKYRVIINTVQNDCTINRGEYNMEEKKNMSDIVAEVKNASEDELRLVIEQHFDVVRTRGMKIGAQLISAAIMGKIEQHLVKTGKISLRDYERCITDIKKIISVQLTRQNDLEGTTDDGTAE
jgi:cell division protein YceG involved in septum cleavage